MTASEGEPGLGCFKPVYFVYGAALIASGVYASEVVGNLTGVITCAIWAAAFAVRSWSRGLEGLLILVLGAAIAWMTVASGYPQERHGPRRHYCKNNLKQLGLALHNYHDVYGSFPPAVVEDDEGRPLHSWRTLILPCVDQAPLHKKYNFDESWNGPHNREVTDRTIPVYVCPSTEVEAGRQSDTHYFAVTGPRTAWPGSQTRTIADITDRTPHTILAIESDARHVPWAEPRDLELEEALDLLTSPDSDQPRLHAIDDYFYEYPGGRNVLMADGSVRFVAHGIDRETWRTLLVVDDGIVEPAAWDDAEYTLSLRWAKVGNHVVFWTFIVLAVLPLLWVFTDPSPNDRR